MEPRNEKVDAFLSADRPWEAEMACLREILLACGLQEEFKWKQPCYMHSGSNVLIIGGFKDFCALSFFKGALLTDPEGHLEKPGENSQASRMFKFRSVAEIESAAPLVRQFVLEAIEIEQSGQKVDFKAKNELVLPEELKAKFAKDGALEAAFHALTPGRQRGFVLHFSAPKQSATRTSRIEKQVPRILAGKGIHDCICGLSKRMPRCDGSHKHI